MADLFKKKRKLKLPINTRAPENAHIRSNINSPDEYSLRLSHTMRICRYITLAILIVFSVVMICGYSENISYENAGRLLSSMKIEFRSPVSFSTDDMSFDKNSLFCKFRSKPVAYDGNKLILFEKNGNISSVFNSEKPVKQLLSCKHFILTVSEYDILVYDSSALINKKSFSSEIYSADLCENGNIAIVTEEVGSRSVVYVLDKRLNTLYIWRSSDKIVLSADISENNILTLKTVYSENGNYITKLLSIDITDGSTASTEHNGIYTQLSVYENAACSLWQLNTASFFKDGQCIKQINTNSDIVILRSSVNRSCFVEDKGLYLTDENGDTVLSTTISETPNDICINVDSVYLLYDDRIVYISGEDQVTYSVFSPLSLICISDRYRIVFTADGIRTLDSCNILND